MTYLPELQRILVEGAVRLEHAQLEPGAAPTARTRWWERVLRRLTRGRMFVLVGVGLLAGGSAAAALLELAGRPSAPPAGHLSSRVGRASSLQVAAGKYEVTVTPDLAAGSVGWCVSAHAQAFVAIGDVPALRSALATRRRQLETRLDRDEHSLAPGVRSTLEREAYDLIPHLLSTLATRNGVSKSLALRAAYDDLFGSSGAGAARCGLAARRGSPIVAELAEASVVNGNGATSLHTAILVFITEAQVAAVRASDKLTLLTRSDPQLPHAYRIAIAAEQTLGKQAQLPLPPWAPAPLALNRDGRPIHSAAAPVNLTETADPWQSALTHPRSHTPESPPAGVCEIRTENLQGVDPLGGAVMPKVQDLPQILAGTYLSCADTTLRYRHALFTVALLVDAGHPGTPPAPLPHATELSRRAHIFLVPGTARTRSIALTARRVGDAWLVVQTSAPTTESVTVLDRLAACVRLTGRCPPA